jgi:hypothetical protein
MACPLLDFLFEFAESGRGIADVSLAIDVSFVYDNIYAPPDTVQGGKGLGTLHYLHGQVSEGSVGGHIVLSDVPARFSGQVTYGPDPSNQYSATLQIAAPTIALLGAAAYVVTFSSQGPLNGSFTVSCQGRVLTSNQTIGGGYFVTMTLSR